MTAPTKGEDEMLYGYVQRPNAITSVLYLDGAKTAERDCHALPTAEAVKAMIAETEVDEVMFGLSTLPRRAVEVNHPKLDQYIRKMVKACIYPREEKGR